jgi:hypothetical protein
MAVAINLGLHLDSPSQVSIQRGLGVWRIEVLHRKRLGTINLRGAEFLLLRGKALL